MTNRKELTQKVLIQLATSPFTLLPLVGGVTLFLANWTFDLNNVPCLIGSIACILASFGVFFTRLALGTEAATQKALAEIKRQTDQEREKALDVLEKKLAQDGDPRTEQCLQDLRTLARTFKEDKSFSQGLTALSTFDILNGVEELFTSCVNSLERSYTLWSTASRLSERSAKRPIMSQRENIIKSVQESIKKLGYILAEMARLGSTQGTTDEIQRIQAELDQSLEIARNVDSRMRQEFSDKSSLDRE